MTPTPQVPPLLLLGLLALAVPAILGRRLTPMGLPVLEGP